MFSVVEGKLKQLNLFWTGGFAVGLVSIKKIFANETMKTVAAVVCFPVVFRSAGKEAA